MKVARIKTAATMLGVAALLAVGDARAGDEPAEVREEDPPPRPMVIEHRWYGWQTLAADAVSVATVPIFIGVPGVLLAAPIVHVTHGRLGAAAVSVGMRGLVVGVLVGSMLGDAGDEGSLRALRDAALLEAVAIGVDASALSFETRTVPARTYFTPTASVRAGGGIVLGVGGAL